ncbi:hypothetical protein PBRA_005220 [Plasmodiophora brassicae]|uniref:NodB homology domain-containing protein n=1 Tax=Plasmodiophora brassicae TaxID=37360 RepID=A0A0G4IN24_PLABS|nr:hypothetical protein PBRA_005220 [Plasmodiophora brassicae]
MDGVESSTAGPVAYRVIAVRSLEPAGARRGSATSDLAALPHRCLTLKCNPSLFLRRLPNPASPDARRNLESPTPCAGTGLERTAAVVQGSAALVAKPESAALRPGGVAKVPTIAMRNPSAVAMGRVGPVARRRHQCPPMNRTRTRIFPMVETLSTPPSTGVATGNSLYFRSTTAQVKWMRRAGSCGSEPMLSLAVVYPESTRQLLADLRRLNMKASFFLAPLAAGRSLDDEQCDLLHEMIRDGHGVHSHSMTHPSFLQISSDEIRNELSRWRQWYRDCRGPSQPNRILFRPPYGDLNYETARQVNSLGFTISTWNIDSNDWQGGDADTIFERSIAGFKQVPHGGSALILHHDAVYTRDGTRGILEKYATYFREERGYKFVTADECLAACSADGSCKTDSEWPGVYDS